MDMEHIKELKVVARVDGLRRVQIALDELGATLDRLQKTMDELVVSVEVE